MAVHPAEKAIRLVDHPEPRLEGEGQVLLQILDVGVCGTDREIARFEYGSPPPGSPYLVLGNVDLVYEATGAAGPAFHALEILGKNGVFVFTGVPGRKGPLELEADDLMRAMVLENQLVFGTVNAGPDAFEAAVKDLAMFHARWPEALGALIARRVAPEEVPAVLAAPAPGMKVVAGFEGAR